jgi:hypothetical protein
MANTCHACHLNTEKIYDRVLKNPYPTSQIIAGRLAL